MPTADGRRLRRGLLIRSSHLGALDDDGRAALTDLGTAEVIDLRSLTECENEGHDVLPGHIRWRSIPFDPNRLGMSGRILTADEARSHLSAVYATYPVLDGAGRAILAVIKAIAAGRGVLVHCTAGKDRTGWAVATVLRAAGVPADHVDDDYLRSNDSIDDLRRMVAGRVPDASSIPGDYLGVRTEYLRSADEAMAATYGDVDGYLTAIGVSRALLDEFRQQIVM